MIKEGATHVAVATDQSSSLSETTYGQTIRQGTVLTLILTQFPLLEEVLLAAGVVVWPIVEFVADDALAAAAVGAAAEKGVDPVIICTPCQELAPRVSVR